MVFLPRRTFCALGAAALARAEGPPRSDLCNRLEPVGRILEDPVYQSWCCSPIDGPDGKVHVFYSRWRDGFRNWLRTCEIAHAVADRAEGPYRYVRTVLKGRGGSHWDADTIHNPTINKVGNRYALFYIGNNLTGTDVNSVEKHPAATQRVGLAMADSLDGPFERVSKGPVFDTSPDRNQWDSYLVTNPALLQHPNGEFWLYYKAWDRYNDGFRKMGLAKATRIEGPYKRFGKNPVVDFSKDRKQVEDAYVWRSGGRYYMLMADNMGGVVKQHGGLLMESADGERWGKPSLGYDTSDVYFGGKRERFERPQLLLRNGRPAYLFLALRGGKYNTSSGAVLRVRPA